jgi:hypothetical protein
MATFPGHLEAAFGADRSGDPLGFTWTDLTDRVNQPDLTISRYRSSPGSAGGETPASGFSVLLANGDGALTPRKAGTTPSYYPNVRRGTPVRHYLTGGASSLQLDGSATCRMSTPDHASFNVGAAMAGAVGFHAPVRQPVVQNYEVFGQFNTSGGQRSWLFFLSIYGHAALRLSSDGTAETDAVTTLALPRPDSGPYTVGWVFDGDDGAGGHTVAWYFLRGTVADLLADPAAYLFETFTGAGTLTLHDSTGTPGVGDVAGSGFAPYPGLIDRVYLRATDFATGTVIVDASPAAEAPGTTSFVDDSASGKTWTLAGTAAITDRKITATGQLAANTATYPGHGVANTAQRTWEIAGILRRLRSGRQAKPLRSALYRAVTAPVADTLVKAYWPLEDGRDSTEVFTPIGGDPGGGVGGSVTLASYSDLAASSPLPSVGGGQPFGWSMSLDRGVVDDTTWEHTMIVDIPVAPDAGAGEYLDLQRINCLGGYTSQWVLRIDDTDWHVFAKNLDGVNVLSTTGGVNTAMFGQPMIVTLSISLSGANITWDLDLIPLDGTGTVYGGSGTLASLTVPAGSPVRLLNLMPSAPQEGFSFGHFILTEGAVSGWLAPADSAFVGEPATTRFARLCREQGIAALVDGPYSLAGGSDWDDAIAAGAQPMGAQRPLPLLTLLTECETIETGIMGESRELLGLTLRSGSTMLEQPPRLTLTSEVVPPLTPTDDDRDLITSATVTRPEGSSAVYTDDTAADEDTGEGLYEGAREINAETDAQLAPFAAWIVQEATWPEERYDSVRVELAKNAATAADWGDFCAGDVLEATSLPDPERSASLTQIANGWTDTIGAFTRTVVINTRPEGPWSPGVLDTDPAAPDTDLARIDSRGTTLTGSLSSSATGGQSVTITGTVWTTSALYQPMIVRIDEEDIELSAISGATSPQTFTIATRGVNGTTAAAHAAGAEIHPAKPLRVARTRRFP